MTEDDETLYGEELRCARRIDAVEVEIQNVYVIGQEQRWEKMEVEVPFSSHRPRIPAA